MTVMNKDLFMHNLWDWAILDGCFGTTRIRPTDIDGLVERNGKFLLLEAKSPGVEVRMGQKITFDHLIKTGVFTVIIIWGEVNRPQEILVWGKDRVSADIVLLREEVTKWYEST